MSILDFIKTKHSKGHRAKTEPIEILKEKADKTARINELKENCDTIRMIYIAMEKFDSRFASIGEKPQRLGTTLDISSPFKLPKGMTIDEACKVISHISEKVEGQYLIPPASNISVAFTSSKLEDYGFKKVQVSDTERGWSHSTSNYYKEKREFGLQKDGVLDLITVGGEFNEFKNSNLYDNYFNWFTAGVTESEVKAIYDRIGVTADASHGDQFEQLFLEDM